MLGSIRTSWALRGHASLLRCRVAAVKRSNGRRQLSSSESGDSLRASRAARMRKAVDSSNRTTVKKAGGNKDDSVLSSGQQMVFGGLVAFVGLATYGSYEIRTNPLGTLATAYYGSFLESAWQWMQEHIFISFDSVYQPHSDQLIPTYEAGAFYGPVPPGAPPPPLLVLDLEKTLIGSVHDAKYGWRHVKRPGIQKFIDRLSQYYEIVIFSENEKNMDILEAIDPERKCHKLGAESAEVKGGVMLKRLDYMNRDLSRIVLIDDSESTSSLFPRNTLLIKPFTDINDKTDNALVELLPLLQALVHDGVKDFRDCFDDLGTHEASEAALEYKMRVSDAKGAIQEKRRKGLGSLLSKKNSGANDLSDMSESGSLLSQIVGEAPSGGLGAVGASNGDRPQATNLDLAGVGAAAHTGVGASADKKPKKREKRKGALFQWLEDSQQESEKIRELKMQKMNEMHMERMRDKESKKNQA